jgi:HAD superfamily hydrolase (TIGR01459 family)
MSRTLRGLSDIADRYDAFIVDLWGVVHNGVTPYPGALACLDHLAGRPVLLLSNAPRRAAAAQAMLRRLGVGDGLYTDILTSGEATWRALRDRTDPWFARLGGRAYHLGPLRDRNVLDGLDITVVAAPAQADFVLNTGPDDDAQAPTELAAFIPDLRACHEAGLPMLCANPDRVVIRGGMRLLCAGALAEYYASIGGDVASIGKPDPAIYASALSRLNTPASHVLAIGDSLHTDIAGAANAGIDSLWILGGIHWDSLQETPDNAARLAAASGLDPSFVLNRLVW